MQRCENVECGPTEPVELPDKHRFYFAAPGGLHHPPEAGAVVPGAATGLLYLHSRAETEACRRGAQLAPGERRILV